jgi:hypothetical protein
VQNPEVDMNNVTKNGEEMKWIRTSLSIFYTAFLVPNGPTFPSYPSSALPLLPRRHLRIRTCDHKPQSSSPLCPHQWYSHVCTSLPLDHVQSQRHLTLHSLVHSPVRNPLGAQYRPVPLTLCLCRLRNMARAVQMQAGDAGPSRQVIWHRMGNGKVRKV